jgi:protoporphyrinogen oxidase
LFETFFDSYTQKVWGLPCSQLSSDWAAQRIQGMSFGAAVREAIFRAGKRRPKTFYDEFLYPRRGPGQLFTKLKERCQQAGATFLLKTRVTGLRHDGRNIVSVEVSRGPRGETSAVPVDQVLSSMPLTDLVRAFSPPPPREVLNAAAGLRFRDFLSVNLIVNGSLLFPDQWIYVHSPKVKLSRIQNFKNWSPDMVGSADKTSLGLEYFCSEGDELWLADDTDLIRLAAQDLEAIGLASAKSIEGGFVVRRDKAYPVYDLGYGWRVSLLKDYLGRFSNFQTLGRAGLFRYDNSDLALLTGIQAADNLIAGGKSDLWAYNVSV